MRPNVKVTTTCLKYFAKVRKKENRFEHRCTVVKNPEGGGSFGCWPNSSKGVLGVVRKSRGPPFFRVFMTKLFKP